MATKVKLIFNPIANLGHSWPIAASLRPIVHELGGADWTGTVYPTHATELARQAGEDGYELVVAMGGDGTVHEVVNGLMQVPAERRPKLGVVPMGSGNDFAYSLGISSQPEEALRQVMAGTPRKLDIGLACDAQGNREYWANTIGVGFDTVVTIRSRKVPIVQGFAIYFAAVLQTILFNYQPFRAQVKSDHESWNDALLMLVLCNGKREGGGFHVAPQASMNDGLFDYITVKDIPVLRMLATIPYFLKGTAEQLAYVRTGKFQRMEIVSDRPMYVHMDGEVYAGFSSNLNYLSVEMLPEALETVA